MPVQKTFAAEGVEENRITKKASIPLGPLRGEPWLTVDPTGTFRNARMPD